MQGFFGNKGKSAQPAIFPRSSPEAPASPGRTDFSPTEPGGPIQDFLRELHADIRHMKGGDLATDIPELAKAKPEHCGIAIPTVDGAIYAVGDCDAPFTIQSVSKPFVYAYALQVYGRESVLRRVGVEPTGEASTPSCSTRRTIVHLIPW